MCLIRVRPEIEEDIPATRARSRAASRQGAAASRSRQSVRTRPGSTVIIAPPIPPPDYGRPGGSQIITAYPTQQDPYSPSIIDASPPPNVIVSPVGGHPGQSVTIVSPVDNRRSRRYSDSTSSTDSDRHTVASPRQSVISSRSREYHGGSFYPQGSTHLSSDYEGPTGRRRANTVGSARRSVGAVNGGGQYGRSSHRSVRSYGGVSDFEQDMGSQYGRRSRDEKIIVVDDYGQRTEYVR